MASFFGEIRMFAGNFAPLGWMFCSGQLLPISENVTLFQVLGTTYGGDGEETFGLPDLQGRLPLHNGNGYNLAQTGGVEEVTLTTAQLPNHTHSLQASMNVAAGSSPSGNVTGQTGGAQIYREVAPAAAMSNLAIASSGGSQPHTNFQPYLCLSFIIATSPLGAIFPSQT